MTWFEKAKFKSEMDEAKSVAIIEKHSREKIETEKGAQVIVSSLNYSLISF